MSFFIGVSVSKLSMLIIRLCIRGLTLLVGAPIVLRSQKTLTVFAGNQKRFHHFCRAEVAALIIKFG